MIDMNILKLILIIAIIALSILLLYLFAQKIISLIESIKDISTVLEKTNDHLDKSKSETVLAIEKIASSLVDSLRDIIKEKASQNQGEELITTIHNDLEIIKKQLEMLCPKLMDKNQHPQLAEKKIDDVGNKLNQALDSMSGKHSQLLSLLGDAIKAIQQQEVLRLKTDSYFSK